MDEEWRDLSIFPSYSVSDLGNIRSIKTGRNLKRSKNQQGHLKVNLAEAGHVHTRNVNHLVAKTFLGEPPREHFDSIIHLDGDKTNCAATNLMWRPRYYSIKYHQQFDSYNFRNSTAGVIDIGTNRVYETIQEAAVEHGLLFFDILVSAHERTYVWPTYQEFRYI